MYVKQLAWLRAVPKEDSRSRLQAYLAENKPFPIPYVNSQALYLANMLDEVGAAMNDGMGMSPLTWQELAAWNSISGYNLTTWELSTIKSLSYAYVAELGLATSQDRPSPYYEEGMDVAAPDLDKKLSNAFRSFKHQIIRIEDDNRSDNAISGSSQ